MSFKVLRQLDVVEVEISEQDSSLRPSSHNICYLEKLCRQFLDKVTDQVHVEMLPSVPNTWKRTGSALWIYINVNKYEYTYLKQTIWFKKKKGNFQEVRSRKEISVNRSLIFEAYSRAETRGLKFSELLP